MRAGEIRTDALRIDAIASCQSQTCFRAKTLVVGSRKVHAHRLSVIAAILLQVPSPPLAETGSIEGVVLGPNGQPIPSARVQAMWVPSPLLVDPRAIPTATTGEDGSFRLDGLMRALLSGEGLPMPVLPTPGSYVPTFYPASSEYSKGFLVEVTRGGEVRNIDIALPSCRRIAYVAE